jgi:hypothetical protein
MRKAKKTRGVEARGTWKVEVVGEPDPYLLAEAMLMLLGFHTHEARRRMGIVRREDEAAARARGSKP